MKVVTREQLWRTTFVATSVTTIVLLLVFSDTSYSMWETWAHNETYTHGFLILPISIWLVWDKRWELLKLIPHPTILALFPFMLSGFAWSIAELAGVQVIAQLSLVGMIVAATTAIVGWRVALYLIFPLLFLFFMVPMGEDLVPSMMEFTATFTVEALQLTGIPVYRDGLWFTLPSGNWSVVEACSGVRYLIASVTLGFLYAYISYHTLWKRLAFIALSAIIPVLANGIRAYVIVMIGHLSNMEYATGVDHLIYGWVFFGFVMMILFWIGSFWQEKHPPLDHVDASSYVMAKSSTGVFLNGLLALILSSGFVLWIQTIQNQDVTLVATLTAPKGVNGWDLTDRQPAWKAGYQPTDQAFSAVYRKDGKSVAIIAALYPMQKQGSEAIHSGNLIVAKGISYGRTYSQGAVDTALDDSPASVNQALVTLANRETRSVEEYLSWQWYRVGGRSVANTYEGKFWEPLLRIHPGRHDGAWLVVATELGIDDSTAAENLKMFLRDMYPQISDQIDLTLGISR